MTFGIARFILYLESCGMATEIWRVNEAQSEDSDTATVEGSDVTQAAVLQVGQLNWLA